MKRVLRFAARRGRRSGQLRAPGGDAAALADVLREFGHFEVRHPLLNEPHHVLPREIDAFFSNRKKDDLLLLYVSCHGVLYEDGQLYFAADNTDLRLPRSTALGAQQVNEIMRTTNARSTVLILDCCHSGAATRGMVAKTTGDVHLKNRFGGQGRIILTASRDTEYAFEGDDLTGEGRRSVFTSAFVDGIRTREADTDGDGVISLQDIYDYVVDRVRELTPHQTPSKWGLDEQGRIIIAQLPQRNAASTGVEERPPAVAMEPFEFVRLSFRVATTLMIHAGKWIAGPHPIKPPARERVRAAVDDERRRRAVTRG